MAKATSSVTGWRRRKAGRKSMRIRFSKLARSARPSPRRLAAMDWRPAHFPRPIPRPDGLPNLRAAVSTRSPCWILEPIRREDCPCSSPMLSPTTVPCWPISESGNRDYPAGTQRRYSNPSIGLFGYLAARSMGQPFDVLMEQKLLPALGLKNTFVHVPESRMKDYAYGYAKADKPTRVASGTRDAEAYGIKTTAPDLLRFVELNIDSASLAPDFQKAVAATHTGYYRVGANNQGLGWEIYTYPVTLKTLLAGNSSDMALKSHKIEKFDPPHAPSADMFINKTGSTKGFGAYAAFVPAKKTGIVLLANRNYPNDERIKAAYRILQAIDKSE
ncbi:Beta-lactamase [Brucella intermedia LMG 3301]|uniref:Beta-lactamase n=1 Tax=Brucella intermedia LMG 3301 TaxID=641118 RepID=C4WE95_9HYPH|nr:Beta-lactamase [Brucella intermedia LMG 3301]